MSSQNKKSSQKTAWILAGVVTGVIMIVWVISVSNQIRKVTKEGDDELIHMITDSVEKRDVGKDIETFKKAISERDEIKNTFEAGFENKLEEAEDEKAVSNTDQEEVEKNNDSINKEEVMEIEQELKKYQNITE